MTTRRNDHCRSGLALIALAAAIGTAHAQNAQWVWTAGKQTNDGQIVLKSVKSPGSNSTVSRNPTSKVGGQVVDVRQSATTQPPLLLKSGGAPNPWSLYYADRAAGGN